MPRNIKKNLFIFYYIINRSGLAYRYDLYIFFYFRLSHMWKHLNNRDKHKYYETATKARTTYNLPEHPYQHQGHLGNVIYRFTL